MENAELEATGPNIGRYILKSKIGSGSYGYVYRAFDPILKRDVAIKIPSLTIDSENLKSLVDSFYHEAELAARLMHPNIVAVYDVGSSEFEENAPTDHYQPHFLVMEYVPGIDLSGYIKQVGQLPLAETIEIIYGCCKALDYMHFNGIIHRDIKPGNVLINPTYHTVKLMDFSVSQDISHPTKKNLGTLRYMSPEHFLKDKQLGPASDLFALGSVMYTMLAGKAAFTASSSEAIAYHIVSVNPVPVSELRDDIDPEVDEFLRTALHKDPKKRFPDALAFADALKQLGTEISGKKSGDSIEDETNQEIEQYLRFRHEIWFSQFPPDQIAELIDAAQIVIFEDNEAIISEGESGREVFTILEGEVTVSRHGQEINILQSGESFGELGFAQEDATRTAQVVARGRVHVLKIYPEKLHIASAETKASLYKAFLDITIKRLQNRTDEVADLKAELKACK